MSGAEPLGFCPHCYRNYPRDPRTGRVISRTCRRRTCPSYASLYLRSLAEVQAAALAQYDGETTIATVTAPGADQLPWDTRKCRIEGPHEHSGPNGCVVNEWDAAQYNLTVNANLSVLVNRAMQRCRNRGIAPPEPLEHVCELKRGVFHVHVVFGFKGYQRKGLDVVLDAMDELRGEYGFGTHRRGFDRGQPGKFKGEDAGRYVSKYLRADSAKGSFVPALLAMEALIPRDPITGRRTKQIRPVWVSSTLTRRSGVTMRFLRWARYAYVKWGRVELPRPELLAIYRLVTVFGAELLDYAPERPNPPPIDQAEDDIPF